jgi:hypothetical protein
MKTIIIPDLHNRVAWVEEALSSPVLRPYDRVVFLGDYFDDFNDDAKDIVSAASWLKSSLQNPNRIHLWGTHDIWYRFPWNPEIAASGNTVEKACVINSILDNDDWNALKMYHYEQGYLMTHAGVHPTLITAFVHERGTPDTMPAVLRGEDIVNKVVKPATDEALACVGTKQSVWFGAGYARMGNQPVGGIVGHTELNRPEVRKTETSTNYCIDTRNKHIGVLEDCVFTYIETKDLIPDTE